MAQQELYPVVLVKAARYNFKDVIVTRGEIINVTPRDRNWLVKTKHFKDYVKEEPIVLVAEPELEEGDAPEIAPQVIGRVPTAEEQAEGSVPLVTPAEAQRTTKRSGPRKGSQAVNEAAQAGG